MASPPWSDSRGGRAGNFELPSMRYAAPVGGFRTVPGGRVSLLCTTSQTLWNSAQVRSWLLLGNSWAGHCRQLRPVHNARVDLHGVPVRGGPVGGSERVADPAEGPADHTPPADMRARRAVRVVEQPRVRPQLADLPPPSHRSPAPPPTAPHPAPGRATGRAPDAHTD